jgi:hypothetical protein
MSSMALPAKSSSPHSLAYSSSPFSRSVPSAAGASGEVGHLFQQGRNVSGLTDVGPALLPHSAFTAYRVRPKPSR